MNTTNLCDRKIREEYFTNSILLSRILFNIYSIYSKKWNIKKKKSIQSEECFFFFELRAFLRDKEKPLLESKSSSRSSSSFLIQKDSIKDTRKKDGGWREIDGPAAVKERLL